MERNWYVKWDNVIYQPGTVSAVGYKQGERVVNCEICTAGSPEKIELVPFQKCINADGQDTAIITAKVLDHEDNLVPTADNQIIFHISGQGSFLGVGNGDPGSHESDKLPMRRAFGGVCQLLIRSKREKGRITVEAVSGSLKKAECYIEVI